MIGACEDFCPQQEAKLRIKEKLLHYLEWKDGQKNIPGILVRQFSRSAAGTRAPRVKDLRTERCLQRTVQYLLMDVILDKRKPFYIVYEFIFDRLRCVRQEVVIQNFDAYQIIKLLQPMIMFLAYSRYILCEESIDNFDPKICDQHLQECLKQVICCYNELSAKKLNMQELRNRNFIEALYQLFNLGSAEALRRGIELPADIRNDELFAQSFRIGLSHFQGNVYRVLHGLAKLPHILAAIAAIKLPCIRRQVYQLFAHAYNNKRLTVPADFVSTICLHDNRDVLMSDCKHYNLQGVQESLNLAKTDFNEASPVKTKRERFVDDKLKAVYLPEVLLLKKL